MQSNINRRRALFRIILGGTALTGAVAGYKWYEISKSPQLSYLDHNKELLAALAETIIPATDSPGAREAGVGEFISLMVKECTERKTQNKFINGLIELKDYSHDRYGKAFEKCSADQQQQVLTAFEKMGKPFRGIIGKAQNKFLGKSFFTTLKQYTVEGYCTSQVGATKGLAYVFIPGNYKGCMPLQPNQKGWATN